VSRLPTTSAPPAPDAPTLDDIGGGPLAIAKGGTGQITEDAAFKALIEGATARTPDGADYLPLRSGTDTAGGKATVKQVVPAGAVAADVVTVTDKTTAVALGAIPVWHKVTLTHADFVGIGTSEQANLINVPAGAVVHSVKRYHTVVFNNVTTADFDVGNAGDPAKYTPSGSHNALLPVDGTNFTVEAQVANAMENQSGARQLYLNMQVNVGAATADPTAGSIDVYLLLSKAV